MQSAYSMKYNAKKMKKLEKEYNVIKTKEQEEMAELKVLRKSLSSFDSSQLHNYFPEAKTGK